MSNLAEALTDLATCASSAEKHPGHRDRPTVDEIARHAYHLYEMRGRQDGYQMEDWLLAERELCQGSTMSDFLVTTHVTVRY